MPTYFDGFGTALGNLEQVSKNYKKDHLLTNDENDVIQVHIIIVQLYFWTF